MRLLLYASMVLLLCVVAGAQDRADEPLDDRHLFGRYAFRGRFIGVAFDQMPGQARFRLSLQFVVDEAYALAYATEPALVTARTSVDIEPERLTPEQYDATIRAALPADLRLGEPYVVATRRTTSGRPGQTFLEARPADGPSMEKFLQDHHESIVFFECTTARSGAFLWRNRAASAAKELDRQSAWLTKRGQLDTSDGRKIMRSVRERLRDVCARATTAVEEIRSEALARADAAEQDYEQRKARWLAAECSRVLREIEDWCRK